MEAELLLWIHELAAPGLDTAFLLSHELGTAPFCTALVIAFVIVGIARKRAADAWLWGALGVSTWLLQEGLKLLVARPRPALWDTLLFLDSFAFPSGHAIAAATFYPLMAHTVAVHWPRRARAAWAMALIMALYIGLGRLYLGVHWPSDVLAGWCIGALQTFFAIGVVRRFGAQRHRTTH